MKGYKRGEKPLLDPAHFEPVHKLYTFSTATYTWKEVSILKKTNTFAKLVVLENEIYSVGGFQLKDSKWKF